MVGAGVAALTPGFWRGLVRVFLVVFFTGAAGDGVAGFALSGTATGRAGREGCGESGGRRLAMRVLLGWNESNTHNDMQVQCPIDPRALYFPLAGRDFFLAPLLATLPFFGAATDFEMPIRYLRKSAPSEG